MANIGRPKGGKNRNWSKEDKLRIIKPYLDGTMSTSEICSKDKISESLLYGWIKQYENYGELGLQKKNNLQVDLPLPQSDDTKQLKNIILMQQIEIERLKKGYTVEGAGANKRFVTYSDVSTKSSKK